MGTHRTWNIGTFYGLDQGFMRGSCVEEGTRKEEEGGERRAPNKAGPRRPPLLNGIKLKGIKHGIYMDTFHRLGQTHQELVRTRRLICYQ